MIIVIAYLFIILGLGGDSVIFLLYEVSEKVQKMDCENVIVITLVVKGYCDFMYP